MEIIYDNREGKSVEIMMKIVDEKLIMKRKRLKIGDYICGDVVIERKEISDFCGSIMDGRMERQIKQMKEKYKNIYVIIVGSIKNRTTEIHENSILGMISSLLVRHKVSVCMIDDDFQFLYLIKRIFERHQEERNK